MHSKYQYSFFDICKMLRFCNDLTYVMFWLDKVACADKCEAICGNRAGCSDIAYPLLVLNTLPVGIRGIMMAALLSALISSLTSIFNSSSTVFTMDLWSLCRPQASEKENMVVGRLWIILMAIVGTLWLLILQLLQGSQFWNYSQSISAYLNPPIVMTSLWEGRFHLNRLQAY